MKKLFILITTAVFILISITNVSASESVSFELTDCNCNKNRLFTVEMVATCSSPLSAASFEFTYDKSMFEYRSSKVTDVDSQIAVNEIDDKIKAVYLNTYGKNIKNGEVIFTITFKAVKSGVGYIDFNVSDCVNSDVKSISAGKCTSAKITVSGNSSDEDENSNNKTSKSKNNSSDSENKAAKKSSRDKDEAIEAAATADEFGALNPIDDKSTRFLFIGICIGVSILALFLLAFYIGRHTIKKNKNDDDSDEINDKNTENNESSE